MVGMDVEGKVEVAYRPDEILHDAFHYAAVVCGLVIARGRFEAGAEIVNRFRIERAREIGHSAMLIDYRRNILVRLLR